MGRSGAVPRWPARLWAALVATLFDRKVLCGLLLGQVLSLLITGTGVSSQYLATQYDVQIPTTQSSFNYLLLLFVYMPTLFNQRRRCSSPSPISPSSSADIFPPSSTNGAVCSTPILEQRESNRHLPSVGQVLRAKWWFYLLLAIADVEANFLVVKAYQYTTITSVMLLDCFTIPCVMVLSFFFLKARYSVQHYLGVILCLIGLGALVASDAHYNPSASDGENPVLGDALCLGGALLYAISNVGQEACVKHFDRVEFLAMLGLFGSALNIVQSVVLEREALANISWSFPVVGFLAAFGLCLFALYSLTPYMLLWTGATLFNLSLLTSDAYAIVAGIFLFSTAPGLLYFVALGAIVVGLVLYNVRCPSGASSLPLDDANSDLLDDPEASGTLRAPTELDDVAMPVTPGASSPSGSSSSSSSPFPPRPRVDRMAHPPPTALS